MVREPASDAPTAAIVASGEELIAGRRTDTNSTLLQRRLRAVGDSNSEVVDSGCCRRSRKTVTLHAETRGQSSAQHLPCVRSRSARRRKGLCIANPHGPLC